MLDIRLPGLLHVLTGPKLEQLQLEALNAPRLPIGSLARAKRSRETHAVVQLGDQWTQSLDRACILDTLGPSVTHLLLLPLSVVLGACRHVGLRDLDQAFLAMVECDRIFKEESDRVLLPLGLATEVPSLLRDLLAEPDALSDAVLPVVGLEHDSPDLLFF